MTSWTPKLNALALALVLAVTSQPTQAAPPVLNPPPRTNSNLYYRIGGGDPASLAANPGSNRIRLALDGSIKLGYSCGKFDVKAMWNNYMAEIKYYVDNFGDVLEMAAYGIVYSLPLYMLQRAQPGLYELLQGYWAKFNAAADIAIKSCEEMEAQIKAGQDPYQDYIQLAKGERWKELVTVGGTDSTGRTVAANDARQVKVAAQLDRGVKGLQAFKGLQRGGAGQPPLRIVRDTTAVGYLATMNQIPATSPETHFPATTRLGKLWTSPKDAADWTVDVVGDMEVATCEEATCGADALGAGKASVTGLGLQPKYDKAVTDVETKLTAVLAVNDVTYDKLEEVSAPGVSVSRDVVDALRRLPASERIVYTQRLAREVALSQTVDRAMAARDLLQTGMTAANYEKVADDANKRVVQLNRYVEDLLFSSRVRKELVSNTASSLLEFDRASTATRSAATPTGRDTSTRVLEGGAVSK